MWLNHFTILTMSHFLIIYSFHWFTDNIDTRSALDSLRELVGAAHIYLRKTTPRSAPLLAAAAKYVTDVLHVFGAVEGPRGGIGFPVADVNSVCVSICYIQLRVVRAQHATLGSS